MGTNRQSLRPRLDGSARVLLQSLFALVAALLLTNAALGHDRPPPTDKPTRVSLGLFLLDVLDIDDSKQTITIDFSVSASWVDSRLADKAGQSVALKNAWAPNLQIVSNQALRRVRPETLQVSDGGHVTYRQRYIGPIWHSSNLSDFPFDTQTFAIQLVTPRNTPADIQFVENKSGSGQAANWSLIGWDHVSGQWELDPYYFQPSQETFAGAAYVVKASRKPGYFFWNVLLPLSLLVLMSGAVFFIDVSNTAPQITLASTAILALVAYRFIVGHMVPDISYLTRLDIFMLGASLLVFLVLCEAVWTGRLCSGGKLEKARRVDRWSRALFMVGFVAVTLIAFVF